MQTQSASEKTRTSIAKLDRKRKGRAVVIGQENAAKQAETTSGTRNRIVTGKISTEKIRQRRIKTTTPEGGKRDSTSFYASHAVIQTCRERGKPGEVEQWRPWSKVRLIKKRRAKSS